MVREPGRERRQLQHARDHHVRGRCELGVRDRHGRRRRRGRALGLFYDDTVAWYENLDGSGGSFSTHVITTSADGAISVFAIDMDGDGDVDVLSASFDDDTVAWYENLDGSGGSFSTHVITTSADGANSVFAIDMDGDGDVDVLSASSTTTRSRGTRTWTGAAAASART